ncbi:hypothetical protein D1872_260710 [compost metagenome]
MQLGNTVRNTGKTKTCNGHIERISTDTLHLITSQAVECGHVLKLFNWMSLVTFFNWSMSCEHNFFSSSIPCFFEGFAGTHFFTDQFSCCKGSMTFVEVVYVDWNLQSTHSFNTADTKNDFLCDTLFAKPSVQLTSNPSITVLRNICIQQIERVVAKLLCFPHFTVNIQVSYFNAYFNTCIF